jgi:hypothetical protein
MIKEVGEVEEKVVFQELIVEVRSQARTLSSVEGLRQMVSFPITIVRSFRGNKNGNKKENNQKEIK